MKFAVTTLAALFLASGSASAIVTQDLTVRTPAQLAQTFVGSGVTVSNVQYTGAETSAGVFGSATVDGIGIDGGVVLSTGNIAGAASPNDSDETTTANATPGDATLQALLPTGQTSQDATVLEFDFVPTNNRISFRYVFASEEYNEYVGQDYNDIFGFFVDGVNIALVPGTSQPVSIDTINTGSNAALFRNNDFGEFASPPFGIEFDGFTVVLTAEANVTAGQTHHIKLAISDVNDEILDSAVFFQAGSFASSCNTSVTATDATASETGPDAGTFTITRTGDTSASLTVPYSIAGTAESEDFVAVSGSVTIPAGQSSATVTITPIADGFSEGSETVTISLGSSACAPANPTTATITITDAAAPPPSCSVSIASTSNGSEDGASAVFTVTRSGSTAAAATITYTVGGTAASGTDFSALSGSVTIPAGQTTATISVTPIDDAVVEGAESVVITLTGGACTLNGNLTANATIADNDIDAAAFSDVPTLGEWALLALAALLGGTALFVIRG